MAEIRRDRIVEAARVAAQKNGGILSRSDFERLTGVSQWHIYKLFPEGGWTEVLAEAGIKQHPQHHLGLSDEDLLQEVHRVVCDLGEFPSWQIFRARASVSADTVRKRFGGLEGTIDRYRNWLRENHPASPFLEMLPLIPQSNRVEVPSPEPDVGLVQWPKSAGVEFGAPIDFRGLRHAPVNEQGVVYLFGMVGYELGFLVEAIHTGFPDCEAKRCIDRRRNRWQRVRIEFEFRSSNFRDHGHDPNRCDLIVCWEHNWADCPLEIIELKSVLDELEA